MPRRLLRLPHLPSLVLATALGAPAWAQSPPDPSSGSPDAGDALPPVTVTSRRRAEDLQQVPISVTAIDPGAAALASSPANSNAGLARAAPNVSFVDSGGQFGNLFTIRGVGSFAPLSPDDTSVVMYFNEVPRSVYGAPPTLMDIYRVEVLRGPQGTLFGRNTQGGAIQVVPHAPTFKPSYSATTEFGSHGHRLGETVFNGPLSDTLAGRLAVRWSQSDGTIPNLVTGGQDGASRVTALRGTLLWTPGERTTATLTGFLDRRMSDAPRFIWLQNPAFPQSAVSPNTRIRWRDAGASLRVEHEFDRMRLTSLTSVQDDRSFQPLDLTDGLIYPALTRQPARRFDVPYADYVGIGFRERTLQQELRLSSTDEGALTWTVGAQYYRSRFGNDSTARASPAAFNYASQNGRQINRIATDSAAVFGEASLALTDRWKATFGLRTTHERKRADYLFLGNGNPAVVPFSDHADRLSEQFTTGRAGVSWQATPDAMLYATVSRGAVAGGFPVVSVNSANGRPDPAYPRSTSWTYEAGLKSQWWEKRLGVNASVFHNDVRNGHLIVFDPSALLFTTAALDYRSTGAEVEAKARLPGGWDLSAQAGYLHAELVDVPQGSSTGARSGNRVPNVPHLTAGLALHYQAPVRWFDRAGKFEADLSWQHVGRRAADVKGSFDLPGYNLVNARAGWTHGALEWYVFARNVLNKQYLVAGQAWSTGVSSVRLGEPRTVGVGLTARF